MKKIISIKPNITNTSAIIFQKPQVDFFQDQLADLSNIYTIAIRLNNNMSSKDNITKFEDSIREDIFEIKDIIRSTSNQLVRKSAISLLQSLSLLITKRRTSIFKALGTFLLLFDSSDGIGISDLGGFWLGNKWFNLRKTLNSLQAHIEKALDSDVVGRRLSEDASPQMMDLAKLIRLESQLISNLFSKDQILKTMQGGSRFGSRKQNNPITKGILEMKKFQANYEQIDPILANKIDKRLKTIKDKILKERKTSFAKVFLATISLPLIFPSYFLYKWSRNRSHLKSIQKLVK